MGVELRRADREEQIVVVDFAVLVAVEVGKIFDSLNVALLEYAEIEVGIDGLYFSTKTERVIPTRPADDVVAL